MGTPKHKKLVFRIAVVASVLAMGVVTLAACGNQAEGERCSQLSSNGGNDDCQDGLICTAQNDVQASSDICCPPDRTTATTAVCAIKHAAPGGDAAPPPGDSGGTDGVASDSAPADSAPADSPAEGGNDGGAG